MKRFLILPLLLIGLLFNGCVNDNDDYDPEYLELGVVYGSTVSNFSIKTDSKLTLYPAEVLPSSYGISDGQRVMVRYTIIEDVENLSDEYTVSVKAIAKIATKPVLHVEDRRDTLKSDPVQIINVWIAQNFLNVEFNYGLNDEDHYFYIAMDPENQLESGSPIILDFHHNANNDVSYTTVRGLLSIPIAELQDISATKINLRFISNDGLSTAYTKDLEYSYGVEEEE